MDDFSQARSVDAGSIIPFPRDTKIKWRICQKKLAEWMRRTYQQDTVNAFVVDLGIAPGTVHNWLYMKAKPSFDHGLDLFNYYGFSFLAACLETPPVWVLECAKSEQKIKLEVEIDRLERKVCAL